MTGTVVWGANNIFTVRAGDGTIRSGVRIKGKVLVGTEGEYNPLAPGDIVSLEGDTIVARDERHNAVRRYNRKRRGIQCVAANVDLLVVVASCGVPAYRDAFVDRVCVMAELELIPVMLVINKVDLDCGVDGRAHAAVMADLGYAVRRVSAATGEGIAEIAAELRGTVALFGQSGVGKSTIINALVPDAGLATGTVSERFDRGRHTTTLARQVVARSDPDHPLILVDTPGVREFDLSIYEATEVAAGFREFAARIVDCRMPSCTHTHEPGCEVLAAVERGAIHRRRYDSYLAILSRLDGELA